jgi:hypothetical protein
MAVMAGLVPAIHVFNVAERSIPFVPAQEGTQIYSNAGGHSFSGCPLSRARTENGKKAGHDNREGATRASHAPISFSHSSSVSTVTPSFLASASFEPAPGPATT